MVNGLLGSGMGSGGGGLLGGGTPAGPPYANFQSWAQANPQTVYALAAGLLAGRGSNGGWNLSGVAPAMASDTASNRQTQMDASTKAAVNDWIKAGGPTDVQHPATAALFATNPRLAEGYITSRLGGGKSNPTDDMREYALAQQQGYAGSFFDYIRDVKKAGAINNNVTVGGGKYGTIPPGFELREGPNGATLVPIPGGPAATEAAAKAAGDQTKKEQAGVYADIVTQDIDRAVSMIKDNSKGIPVTGLPGALGANVPGTPAFNTASLINTVKANVGFDRLQQMRNASPTGGALGPVSDFENRLLQATIGNLEQSQSEEQLLFNLERVKKIYSAIITTGIQPGDPIISEVTGDTSASGGAHDWTDIGDGVRLRVKP